MNGTVLYERSLQGGVILSGETPEFFARPTTAYYADRLRYLPTEDSLSISVGKSVTAPERGVENRYSKRHFIHYIHRGALYFNGERIEAGQGFYCPPDFLHTIRSDKENPAVMHWLSAGGSEADRMFGEASLPRVFSFEGEEELLLLERVLYCPRRDYDARRYFRSLLQMILALRNAPPKASSTVELHVQNALSWLEEHEGATVEQVAKGLYLNRKYLFRIFQQVRGETLQEYLQTRKMQRAKAMLAKGATVAEVAEAVGYSDGHAFSHAFRKFYGHAPSRSPRATTKLAAKGQD